MKSLCPYQSAFFAPRKKNVGLWSDQILRSKSSRELFNILYIFSNLYWFLLPNSLRKVGILSERNQRLILIYTPIFELLFCFLLLNRVSTLIDFPGKIKECHIGKKYETFGHGDETHWFFIVSNDSQERSRPTSEWRRFLGHVWSK